MPDNAERWLEALNGQGAEIPGFGLVRISSVDDDGVLTIAQPNSDGQDVMVCGALPLPTGGTGLVTRDDPVYALYDTGDGTPAAGETWGAGNASYKLRKNNTGFTVLGGVTDGRVLVRRAAGAAGADYSCLLKSIDATNTVSASGGTLTIAWDDETWDTNTYHDNSSNPERITFTTATAGKYAIWFNIRLEIAVGTLTLGIMPRAAVLLNGSDALCNVVASCEDLGMGAINYHLAWYGEYSFVNNDYITLVLTNNTGDILTVAEQNYYTPRFGVRKVDKAG